MAKSKRTDSSSIEVGPRLRALRESRGLSVRSLAKLAGITAGTLSKIENRLTSPSVGTLKDTLDALGTTLGEFFAATEIDRGDERHVFRPAELVNHSSEQKIVLLGPPLGKGEPELQIFHETYAPGADTGKQRLHHEGEDAGFCIAGTMELLIADKRYILGPGDAFHFRSDLPHRWRNVGRTKSILVTACTPPSF